MKISLRPRLVAMTLLAANLLGAGIFLAVASLSWIEPELADVPGASDALPFIWVGTAVPIVQFFALLDINLLAWACITRHWRSRWTVTLTVFLCVPLWLWALVVDNRHHGTI